MSAFPTAIASVSADIARQRENMRKWLALLIIGLVGVLSLAILAYVWAAHDLDGAQLLMAGLFTPVLGIAGTVLGFYFGAHERRR